MRVPHLPSAPPLWREGLMGLEAAGLARDPLFRGEGIPDAQEQPVLLVPGFLAGDGSLRVMTNWLRRTGHRTKRAGLRSNVDCSAVRADRMAERVHERADRHGRRVAVVGQSRGGTIA